MKKCNSQGQRGIESRKNMNFRNPVRLSLYVFIKTSNFTVIKRARHLVNTS